MRYQEGAHGKGDISVNRDFASTMPTKNVLPKRLINVALDKMQHEGKTLTAIKRLRTKGDTPPEVINQSKIRRIR